jgi:hypothetical protein
MSDDTTLQRVLHYRHHPMRAYYIPIAAGIVLIVSAFLPWMFMGETRIGGVPDAAGFWILGLGVVAVVLASLSIWTRKNSRHPLLMVGLVALAITFLGYQWMSRSVRETAWARSQAQAIVENTPVQPPPATAVGMGIYLGMAAAAVLVIFGLTIVFKRVPRAYAAPEDDDI